MKIVFTKHSLEMIVLRRLSKAKIIKCINVPDQTMSGQENKIVYLKDMGVNYLKVIAVRENEKIVVITAYWLAKSRIKS